MENNYVGAIVSRLNTLSNSINTLERLSNEDLERKRQKLKKAIDYFDEIIKAEIPSKDLLNNVLKEIKIYHDKTIKFELKMEIDKLI